MIVLSLKLKKENIQKAKSRPTSLIFCIIKSNLARVKTVGKTSGEKEKACINPSGLLKKYTKTLFLIILII